MSGEKLEGMGERYAAAQHELRLQMAFEKGVRRGRNSTYFVFLSVAFTLMVFLLMMVGAAIGWLAAVPWSAQGPEAAFWGSVGGLVFAALGVIGFKAESVADGLVSVWALRAAKVMGFWAGWHLGAIVLVRAYAWLS